MAIELEAPQFYRTIMALKGRRGPEIKKYALVKQNMKLYEWFVGNSDADDSDTDADTLSPTGGTDGRWKRIGYISLAQADDVGALTSSAGTPSATISDVGSSFSQTTLNNNFASLTDQLNDLRTALRAAGVMA